MTLLHRFACAMALITFFSPCRAATFSVTSTNDDGPGSLRAALVAANASADSDSIVFAMPGTGPWSMRPASPFPAIQYPVNIDATTQPGYAGKPLIELDGSLAGQGAWGVEMALEARLPEPPGERKLAQPRPRCG